MKSIQATFTSRFLAALALAILVASACSDKAPKTKRMAQLCARSTEMLRAPVKSKDPRTIDLMLGNALTSCSAACDGKDPESCNRLDLHLAFVCNVDTKACAEICAQKSGELKRRACALAAAKG